jgi:hypothetical protein
MSSYTQPLEAPDGKGLYMTTQDEVDTVKGEH